MWCGAKEGYCVPDPVENTRACDHLAVHGPAARAYLTLYKRSMDRPLSLCELPGWSRDPTPGFSRKLFWFSAQNDWAGQKNSHR